MSKQFGSTTHSEIMHAFEAERRQHTFVEQLPNGEHRKTYELRLSLDELLTLLESLGVIGSVGSTGASRSSVSVESMGAVPLEARQLRAKILGTLGLFEGI